MSKNLSEEKQNENMQEIAEENPQTAFLTAVKPYCIENEPLKVKTDHGTFLYHYRLKPEINEHSQIYKELAAKADRANAQKQAVPFGFALDSSTIENTIENIGINQIKSLYLHESQLEDGGPQPRGKIDFEDPKVQRLYGLIKSQGQRDPIKVYPSPQKKGKYRIRDGNCRRLIIFSMLKMDTIWAVSEECSHLQVCKDALILNIEGGRNNLSAYDTGRYIKEVLMKEFADVFPKLSSLEKHLQLDQSYISQVISAYETVQAQEGALSTSDFARAKKLTEKVIRPLRKAPIETQPKVLAQIIDKSLSARQTEKLIETVNTNHQMSEQDIAKEAERIKEEKAKKIEQRVQEIRDSAQKYAEKIERQRTKIVQTTVSPPEAMMRAVYGHLGLKGKVTPEKAQSYASTVIGLLWKKLKPADVDAIFEEASAFTA